jgi:hypothetical protein
LEIAADPAYLVEEQGREPWVLPENALAIVMYSDGILSSMTPVILRLILKSAGTIVFLVCPFCAR